MRRPNQCGQPGGAEVGATQVEFAHVRQERRRGQLRHHRRGVEQPQPPDAEPVEQLRAAREEGGRFDGRGVGDAAAEIDADDQPGEVGGPRGAVTGEQFGLPVAQFGAARVVFAEAGEGELDADEFGALRLAGVVEEVGVHQPRAVVRVPVERRVEERLLVREVHSRMVTHRDRRCQRRSDVLPVCAEVW